MARALPLSGCIRAARSSVSLCGLGECDGYVLGRIDPAEAGYRLDVKLYRAGRSRPSLRLSRAEVSIRGRGYMKAKQEKVRVEESARTRKIDFVAEKGATLRVAVDDLGQAAEFVLVSVKLAGTEEEPERRVLRQGPTVTFDGLKPGTYEITLLQPMSDRGGKTTQQVGPGADIPVTVRLGRRL